MQRTHQRGSSSSEGEADDYDHLNEPHLLLWIMFMLITAQKQKRRH